MPYQVIAPVIGEILFSPEVVSINEVLTISVQVTEAAVTVETVCPHSGEVNSGEELRPWL